MQTSMYGKKPWISHNQVSDRINGQRPEMISSWVSSCVRSCTTSAYVDATGLHRFGQFDAFLDIFFTE